MQKYSKAVLSGMYEYAVRKKYLTENPLAHVKILVRFKQVMKKTGKTETSDTSYLAVKIDFLLGLRVGELVALKWEDWCDTNHLHIVREEVRDQTDNSYSVAEHTKTNHDRFVVVVPKAADILIFRHAKRAETFIM